MSSILEKLTPIFRTVLDNDDLILAPDMTAADVEGWDSLAHIRLVVSIEEAFKIRFTASEVSALQNVGDLITLVTRKQTNAA
jgi:acyl carrier protein